MIFIGIDGGKHTGVAVWDTSRRRFREIEEMPLHRAFEFVMRWKLMAEEAGVPFRVYVEDPRQRKWFPKDRSESEYRGHLMGAGAAKRDATEWEDFLADHLIPYELVAPKNNRTKMNAVTFKCITGWEPRTNEHKRDAAMLVFAKFK